LHAWRVTGVARDGQDEKTAPTEAIGSTLEGSREAKTEIRAPGETGTKQRMQESHEKGVATRSASSFASGAARYLAKRKQRYRWAGYRASKDCSQDADAVNLAEGNLTGGASASRRSVPRSRRPQTRLEASCTRTGRPSGRLGPNWVETGPRRRKPHGGYVRSGGVGPRRTTEEAAAQERATFGGGGGRKGVAQGEHRTISHVPDTERKNACARDRAVCGGQFAANI
jgi:hypothetical protein